MFPGSRTITDEEGFFLVDRVLYGYFGTEEHIAIPDGVTSIGAKAFKGCIRLENITIPDSVEHISEFAFDSCPNLTIRVSAALAERFAAEFGKRVEVVE